MESGAQPNNDNSAKGKDWKQAIKRALARRGEGDYRKGLDRIAEKVVSAAEEGDGKAWSDIADRFDGKAVQSVEVEGDFTLSIQKIERVIIDSANPKV